jgi:putative ABC transport system permease protein
VRRSTLLLRSLRHYWRTNLGLLAGAGLQTAILVGALVVGDSVRSSLTRLVDIRLGRTETALASAHHWFRAALATELAQDLETDAAPVLRLEGVVSAGGGVRRANRAQVLGVDAHFWRLADATDPLAGAREDQVAINRQLAERLGVAEGDRLVLRIGRRNHVPGDLPLSSHGATGTVPMGCEVIAIVDDQGFGRFGLEANQVAPLSVFLALDALAGRLQEPGRANLVLVAGRRDAPIGRHEATAALAAHWQLTDVGLDLHPSDDGLELVSDQVFVPPAIERAACVAARAEAILTYFVNRLEGGEGMTPYSFVTARAGAPLPAGMGPEDIIINRWLAEDLGIGPGNRLTVSYFVPDASSQLEERTAGFVVREVVPLTGVAADPSLSPAFPGLSDVASCSDWDPSLPIELGLVREQDEAYWECYHATPKAFISLEAGRALWANRFGSLTALRFAEGDREALSAAILDGVQPAELGLAWIEVRATGLAAGAEAVDFGQLFLGLSFFLIVAALLITALLFALSARQRSHELGILRALGWPAGTIRRYLVAEGAVLAGAGAALGGVAGLLYTHVVLLGLGSVWQGAVGTAPLEVSVQMPTLSAGMGAGVVLAVAAMTLALGRDARRPVPGLLGQVPLDDVASYRRRIWRSLWIAVCCATGVTAIVLKVGPGQGRGATGAFWIAGTLMLIATLAVCAAGLSRLGAGRGMVALGVANAGRKRRRSLVAIAVLAIGVFVVIAVAANRRDPQANVSGRASGTGGFALYGETTIPVALNLETASGRRRGGLDPDDTELSFVMARATRGDDASCLNLNRTRHPTILGLDPAALDQRSAFSFVKLLGTPPEAGRPWSVLDQELGDGIIPAVADHEVIVWGLGLSIGDEIELNDERGRVLRLRLVGGLSSSVFQGAVLISEQHFTEHFPSVNGWQVLLVDAPAQRRTAIADRLRASLADTGLELTGTGERLQAFLVVENTYLSIFLALGGLGLAVGTGGIGIVVLRDVVEARGQLALLRAIGFSRSHLRRMLGAEYGLILIAGVAAGTLSALVAVLPALLAPGAVIPFPFVALCLLAILASGAGSVALAAHLATRGEVLQALRK